MSAQTQIAIIMTYTLICFVGTLVNVTILAVIIAVRKLRTATNMFIANLAVSDLLMNVAIILTPLNAFRNDWIWGVPLCKIFFTISAVGVLISSFTLAAIAFYRYNVICRSGENGVGGGGGGVGGGNRRYHLRSEHAVLICAGIWVFALSVCVPLLITVTVSNKRKAQCLENWSDPTHRNVFTWCLMLLQFALPVTLMTYCHVRIHTFLRAQLKAESLRSRSVLKDRRLETLRRRECVHRVLFAMVVAYTFCWLPLNLFNIVFEIKEAQVGRWEYTMHVYFTVHILAMLSTVLDPLLYAVLNRQIRTSVCSRMRCGLRPSRQSTRSQVEHSTKRTYDTRYDETQTD